jgi:nucleoside transporter
MQSALKVKLSVFMFLQYLIWGSWYVSMGAYLTHTLKFGGEQVGLAYGAFAIGSMISPFFVGLVADRYFASEKMLAVLGIVGGVILLAIPQMTGFRSVYFTLILYCATFTPTLALGNSLSMHQLADAKVDFPKVKIWSAVGWIASGLTISLLSAEQTATQFYFAGGISILMGLFAFTLPHTPPKKVGQNVTVAEVLGLDALALLRKPSFAIFIGCIFLICVPLYFYFVNIGLYLTDLGWTKFAWKLTLAQVSDVIFLFLLALMLKTLGYKKTIFLGILAWCVRYFLLAGSVTVLGIQTPLIFAAILLHGVCYDFLFIAGQLYVDAEANEKIRGACQGFIAFILWGVGSFAGTYLAGKVLEAHTTKSASIPPVVTHDWQAIWMTPAIGATVVLVIFLIFFREPPKVIDQPVIAGRAEEALETP